MTDIRSVIVADPKTYAEHLGTADALLVRSAVRGELSG